MSVTIHIKNLVKTYEEVKAVKNISLSIQPNELFGFIGPDGAGKTTIFRILTSLILADSGQVTIDQWDVVNDYKSIRKITGYMPGRFSLYMDLTVQENLEFYAKIFGTSIEENYDLIKDVYEQIAPFKDRRAGALSGGMKQKLALSCALIHKPRLLILDEPTTGVDAVSRKEFWELLKKMQKKDITILVSTPYMDEAALCDRVALMQSGTLMTVDAPKEIVKNFDGKLFAVKTDKMYPLLNDLSDYENKKQVYRFGEFLHMVCPINTDPQQEIEKIKTFLSKKGHKDIVVEPITPVIEDCFLDLMNKNA
ncbi:ABC transporter ATP-binding protein [Candidatus Sulfidibacterium hydrothermale]|uniref:ABC transporter ATP-binding protein n=1 Tax=Candidatus Sulfidibacterium hydrothermale TaxID=2875962 RepID=UPI001F0A7771|nr:ABC transporter ATP-binding protein [Candidatus Sulfidibacterium hydrothermale]UBM62300.1 ABC transporter ATP-binding protein [Candidatus Sulfidibacterium hydrothermale]